MSSKFHLDLTPEEGILLLTGARLLDKLVAGIRIQSTDRDELIEDVISKVAGHVPRALNRLSGEIADAIVCAVAGNSQGEDTEVLSDLSGLNDDEEQQDSCTYPMYPVDGVLPVIEKSITNKLSLSVEYYSFARESMESLMLDPLALVQDGDLWKMVAFCKERDEVMIFRADRIKSFTQTEHGFEVPGDFDPQSPLRFAG